MQINKFSFKNNVKFLRSKLDDSNDSSFNPKNRIFRRSSQSKRFRRLVKEHQMLKIYILAGISLAAIITFYPPIRKLVFSLIYLLKYKLYDYSSLKDPNSTELIDNKPKSKRGLVLLILLSVGTVVVGILNPHQNENYSPEPAQPSGTNPKTSFATAMFEIALKFILLCLGAVVGGPPVAPVG